MISPLVNGLLVLQGNRLEALRDVVLRWTADHPLAPLEEENFIVQSNGAAEWLKMNIAAGHGVCAAARFELPGRFLWRTYRRMLGDDRVPARSAMDRDRLTWRLMRLLPALLDRPAFEPVAKFLADRDPVRRLQLARRLADLFEQYQIYRGDWLADWEQGGFMLPAQTTRRAIPDDQRWQAVLWRAVVAELGELDRASARPRVHRAFIDAIAEDRQPRAILPRRVILFGASHLSTQNLEALVALSARSQVILAIPNPCRYHWADIIDGREALRAFGREHRRHAAKDLLDLAATPLETIHLHAHPLLAAWGRQGRDFMRQLDAFDDSAMRRSIDAPRVDLYDDDPGTTLLAQVQAAIRDLVPLHEHPDRTVASTDRSIVFHVAHGVRREVEILHDQLLAMLAAAGGDLRPRDIVVMVPDIEAFAPSIRAVFGQHGRGDARHVPFDIADLRSRGSNPLFVGLEWLLRLPDQRMQLQQLRDLLDIPAAAARSGIAAEALPGLFAWLAGAGVRWGLHASQRASLGLGAAGDQNSWWFGIRRMLLGYASGTAQSFEGIEPYDEIGGLDATLVGLVIDLVERLDRWWAQCAVDATPDEWGVRGRALIDAFFDPTDERERLTIAALENALATWLASCEATAFEERVPLAIMREAWLAGVDGLDANRRFMTGGVTFCTLIPLRAVPFEVVCLLGMNDGDFPRRQPRDDFDLIGLAGQQRPGDRSRRDDDRYVMLEALLSARRTLYVSWCGRNARDNEQQPPSVLVAQLRDYLRAGWSGREGSDVLADLTIEHPLQPFGRRYFEAGGLVTFAREWRPSHGLGATSPRATATTDAPPMELAESIVTLVDLGRFLRNPVRAFFRNRLDVQVVDEPHEVDDDEAFELDGLRQFGLRRALIDHPAALVADGIVDGVRNRIERIRRTGALPMFERGERIGEEATALVVPMLERWDALRTKHPDGLAPFAVHLESNGIALDDWITDLRSDGRAPARLVLTASRITDGKQARADKLVDHWLAMLALGACGHAATTLVVGCDATLAIPPLERAVAAVRLQDLLDAWAEGMRTPIPLTARSAVVALGDPLDPRAAASVYEGSSNEVRGDRADFGLSRLFPDFDALIADGRFARYANRLFAPLLDWSNTAVIELHATVGTEA